MMVNSEFRIWNEELRMSSGVVFILHSEFIILNSEFTQRVAA